MTASLKTMPCPCGAEKKEVINAEKNLRQGWYCGSCKHFTKAIGRERIWRGREDTDTRKPT